VPDEYRWSSFRAWSLGEIDIVQVECGMVRARSTPCEDGSHPFSRQA
jgi:hypothetical protein